MKLFYLVSFLLFLDSDQMDARHRSVSLHGVQLHHQYYLYYFSWANIFFSKLTILAIHKYFKFGCNENHSKHCYSKVFYEMKREKRNVWC